MNSLSCNLGNDGIVIRLRVPHGFNETEASMAGILAILVVADLVHNKQHIDLKLGDQNNNENTIVQSNSQLAPRLTKSHVVLNCSYPAKQYT